MFDRHFWCLFCLLFTGIRHLPHVLTVPPTKACLLCATPAGMDLYTGPCPKAVTDCSPLDFRRSSILSQPSMTGRKTNSSWWKRPIYRNSNGWNFFAVVGQCDLDSVLIPPDESDSGFWPARFQKKLHSLPVLIRSAIKLSIGKMRNNLQRIFRPHLRATVESDLQSWHHFLACKLTADSQGRRAPERHTNVAHYHWLYLKIAGPG